MSVPPVVREGSATAPSTTHGSPLRRVALLAPGLVLLVAAIRTIEPIKDPDTFWHLKAGRLLLDTWQFTASDPFSASSTQPWIFNQWLPQLLMTQAESWFGLPGVAWLVALGAVVVLLAIWVACRRRASVLVSAVVMAVAFVGLSGSVSPRPQMLTFLFVVVATDAYLRTLDDGRPRWWLIGVTWLWACCHGLWFLGPAIGFLVVAGQALTRTVSWRGLLTLAAVPVLSTVAAALTPVGPGLLSSPFQVHGVTAFITEWQPPDASDPAFLAVLALLLPVAVTVVAKPSKRSVSIALVAVLAFWLAITYGRTVAVAAAMLAPLAAEALQQLIHTHREPKRVEATRTIAFGAVGLVVAAALAPTLAAKPAVGPNSLDPAIASLPQGSVVCNAWEDGGWFIWRHPNVKVTMDPRVELYSTDHIESYLDFIAARPGWDAYVKDSGCRYAVLPTDSPTIEALRTKLSWTKLAQAGGDVLLGAP